MKRNYIPFIAGMSTMLLLVGLVGASLAGETRPPAVPQSGTLNGQVAYGEAGVALFGKEQVPAGAAWTTEDGAQIPTVLTYTDENGEDHYFISAETAAEVLDMVYGAVYREDLNCIDFGTEAAVDAEGNPRLDGNGQPIYWTGAEFFSRRTTQNEDGTERIIAIGNQKAEIQVGDGTSVIVGHGLEEDSPIREELIQRQMETPTVPEYGVSCGVFTEVDPAVLDPAAYLGRFVDGVALQGADLTYTFHFMPELPYAALVIENQGDQDILVRVFRPWTVGHINQELFSMVRIPAGETLVRAFQVQEGESADLRNKLTVEIPGLGLGAALGRRAADQSGGITLKAPHPPPPGFRRAAVAYTLEVSPCFSRAALIFSSPASVGSHNGRRRGPTSQPSRFSAVLTGMGFTSQNMASQKSFSSSCSFPAAAKSFRRHSSVSRCISAGRTLATTEMTPLPPSIQMAAVSSSLPDQMEKSSGHRFRVF